MLRIGNVVDYISCITHVAEILQEPTEFIIGAGHGHCVESHLYASFDEIFPIRETAPTLFYRRLPNRYDASTHTVHRTSRHIHTHPKHSIQGHRQGQAPLPSVGVEVEAAVVHKLERRQHVYAHAAPPCNPPPTIQL